MGNKTNLTVNDFEDKKYGAGKRYTRFETSEGWISCFDKKTIEALKDAEGDEVCVTIETDKNDREKITKVHGKAEDSDEDDEQEEKKPRKSAKGSAYEKDPVGLAIEIYCGCQGELPMEKCIERVKQAQEAFKKDGN